jgi:hypothetical protein
MGVAFADLDPALEERLRRFLSELRERFAV